MGGVRKRVVAVGLKIGRREKVAGAGGSSRHEDLGRILRAEEFPADRDGVGEFLRTERVEASAADGAVFDAADISFQNRVRLVERGDPVGAVLDDGFRHGRGGHRVGAGLETGIGKHPHVDGFHLLHHRGFRLTEMIAGAGCEHQHGGEENREFHERGGCNRLTRPAP